MLRRGVRTESLVMRFNLQFRYDKHLGTIDFPSQNYVHGQSHVREGLQNGFPDTVIYTVKERSPKALCSEVSDDGKRCLPEWGSDYRGE